MKHWLRKLALWLGIVPTTTYAYPALDIHLQGGVNLHLVGSIHMGTENMSPLPDTLIQRLKQADALIVEADITRSSPLLKLLRQKLRWSFTSLTNNGYRCNSAVKKREFR